MKLKLDDAIYNFLKYLVMYLLPALGTLVIGLSKIWGWTWGDSVAQTITVVTVFIASAIGVSSISYNAEKKEDVPVAVEETDVSHDYKKDMY